MSPTSCRPAEAAQRGGADAVSLINTVNSFVWASISIPWRPWPHRRPRHSWRLLRAGDQADRTQHGRVDRGSQVTRHADLRYRRHRDLARCRGIYGDGRRQRPGLHRGDALRLQDRPGDDRRSLRPGWTRRVIRAVDHFVGQAMPRITDWQHLNLDYVVKARSTRIFASSAAVATSPARILPIRLSPVSMTSSAFRGDRGGMRWLQPMRGRVSHRELHHHGAAPEGEIDRRTGLKVGGHRTWLEHPNNPLAKEPRPAKFAGE